MKFPSMCFANENKNVWFEIGYLLISKAYSSDWTQVEDQRSIEKHFYFWFDMVERISHDTANSIAYQLLWRVSQQRILNPLSTYFLLYLLLLANNQLCTEPYIS